MNAARMCFGLLAILPLASPPAPAAAQPVGSEFLINTYTTSDQDMSSSPANLVASDASGNFVVVWEGSGQDGNFTGIFGQRYDGAGERLGSEFRVNSYTTGGQRTPSIAADGGGDFVVVWQGDGEGDASGIFGQRYDSGGGALGSEFRVNSSTRASQESPSVASDASGNFIVVWHCFDGFSSCGIFGQRYDSEGVAQGGEFEVDPGLGYHSDARIASDAIGNFVVVWDSPAGYYGYSYVLGRRYDEHGIPQGNRFQVNPESSDAWGASVAADAIGNFVVVWEGDGQGDSDGIFGQRYDSTGGTRGSEFRINSNVMNSQDDPSVASDASGNFVVVWECRDGFDNCDIFGRRYDSEGVVLGGEFQINSNTTGDQERPSVATTGTGQFVVAWESEGQDGDAESVFGQRFDFGGDSITVVSPNTNVKWRIGSQQRIKWTHNLGLDAIFGIELDRNDDGNYEELIATAAPADSASRGHFAWTVTGPPSGTARVRVSWTDDLTVSDASNVTFQIRPVP